MDAPAYTPWTSDDTEAWLSSNPLPAEFRWRHRDNNEDGTPRMENVLPSYRLHKGYGFWLRTTPYFPGLFEDIHEVLCAMDPLPDDGEALAVLLAARMRARGVQSELFSDH